MFWFDPNDQRVLFGDNRTEEHILCDGRTLTIKPDTEMDFRDMPFDDGAFKLVVFDPPHLKHAGAKSWLGLKYGILSEDWRDDIRRGFAECFRVLATDGVLIFKWAEVQILTSEVLKLAEHRPLFGHKSGKRANTHWLCFMKPSPPSRPASDSSIEGESQMNPNTAPPSALPTVDVSFGRASIQLSDVSGTVGE